MKLFTVARSTALNVTRLGTLLVLMLASINFADANSMTKDKRKLDLVPPNAWEVLARKKIYFGHQSVGDNILTGMREVLVDYPHIRLQLHDRNAPLPPKGPGFVDGYVGTNEQPLTKNVAFKNALNGALNNNVDVAFFKYCYVDINPSTDVVALFQTYQKEIEELKRRHPNVTFVHITAPLTTVQGGWKGVMKKMLGRSLGGYPDNAKRHEYNELLRREYAGKAPVFDLAKLEATRPDGTLTTYEFRGQQYISLAPEYTDDGGHLNALGRKYIAEELLYFLATQVAAERI